ncbi:MAG: hypothetical protein FD156_689 [Nitrospirae bacterium]|nr:MAG: hypothetical protein FD156_689 [Nitrospirota bacterium]
MKTVGRTARHKKGFDDALNGFLKLLVEFRKDKSFIPRGVFRFKTFEEAEKWHHKMLRGKIPDRRQ